MSILTAITSGVPIPLPLRPFSFSRSLLACQDSTDSPSLKFPAVGVGSSAIASSRFRLPCEYRNLAVLTDIDRLEPSPSRACGVGSSCITALGSIKSPLLPRWFGPPFSPSDAHTVDSRAGDDEDPEPAMGGANVGRS
jgi:hypothetical protein